MWPHSSQPVAGTARMRTFRISAVSECFSLPLRNLPWLGRPSWRIRRVDILLPPSQIGLERGIRVIR